MTIDAVNQARALVSNLSVEDVRKAILSLPELAHWPEVEELLFPATQHDQIVRLDWQLPGIACEAVSGSAEEAVPAIAAMACLQRSIILVDDMLDEEPAGVYRRLGIGRTANLTLALQAAAHLLVEKCPVAPQHRTAAALSLTQMALNTAAGQALDVQNLVGEAQYWQVIRAKSTPFYAAGLEAGAYLAGSTRQLAQDLYYVGVLFGEAVQIADDLEDAFKSPANADWVQGRNNLAILYCMTAEHPDKERFLSLKPQISDVEKLLEAQQILIQSGAVSYCIYQLIERHGRIRRHIGQLPLANPTLLTSLLGIQLVPLQKLLGRLNLKLPEDFLDSL